MTVSANDQDRVREFCKGCAKFDSEAFECIVFVDPYPLWGKGECWSRADEETWEQTKEEVRDYIDQKQDKGSINQKLMGPELSGLRQVYQEEVNRAHAPGGGDKQKHKSAKKPKRSSREPWQGY